MAQQSVVLTPPPGTDDAAAKINANFTELYGAIAPVSSTFSLEQFGSAVGGFWDAALVLAMAAIGAAGGGTLEFGPKTYAFANQWPAIPTNGSNTAVPLLLQGSGPTFNGHWTIGFNGGTILDLQNAAGASGKIFLSGIGYVGARDITFYDSTSAGGAHIYTTNATIDLERCAFVGFNCFPNNNLPADQDAIICGGTTTTVTGVLPTAAFQGYGSKVRNCYFAGIRRGVYGRTFANGIVVTRNVISASCGTKKSGVSADLTPFFAFDGATSGGNAQCVGNIVRDNLFECQYLAYAVLVNQGNQNIIGPNGYYDSLVGNMVAPIRLGLQLGPFNGTATAGSPIITGVVNAALLAGMHVSGIGIPSNATVTSFIGTNVTLNKNAQVTGNANFNFSAPTDLNTIIAGTSGVPLALVEDNTNGGINAIDDQQASGSYSRAHSLVAYPQGGPAMTAAQFGSPETFLNGFVPILITPDFPANAGIPNNTARAGQITVATPMIRVAQAAADGGAFSFQVNYDGSMLLGASATSAMLKTNGQTWQAQGVGAQMTWDSGTGGSYAIMKHFGMKRGKYDGSGNVKNAQNTADGSDVWALTNYVTKNYVEVTTPITVAQLPAGVLGMKYMVSDATAPVFNATVVGGGAVTVPVFYNGANWVVG